MKRYIIDGQISRSHFDEIEFPIVDINKPVRFNKETGCIENVSIDGISGKEEEYAINAVEAELRGESIINDQTPF